MNEKMFSVYDSKANAYLNPFYARTTGVAIRQFTQAVNDQTHDFHKFAGDYTLFELGEFNVETGHVTMLKNHANLGLALTYITDSPE